MIRFSTCYLTVALVSGLIDSHPAWSQDEESIEKRIEKLESENKELKDIIKQLKDRLDELEASKKPVPVDQKAEEKKKKKTEPAEDESAAKEKPKEPTSWLPSLEGETFRLGGRFQFEYFDTEPETRLPSAFPNHDSGSFALDEFRVYLDADFKNKVRFHGKFDVEGEDTGLVEAYVDFEELPLSSQLRLGLQPRFFRPSRYTEHYPLTGMAFWRTRDLGITWKGDYNFVYGYLSLLNGANLDNRGIGEDGSSDVVSERSSDFDLNGDKEFLGGIGFKYDFKEFGSVDLLLFGLTGDLSDEDIFFLQDRVPNYRFSFDDTKEMIGANFEYKIGEWDFFGQVIDGNDGELERFSWYTELSYKFNISGLRYLNSVRPLIRYSELDTNMTPSPFHQYGSLGWDRQQVLLGVIAELVRNVNFRTEYAINDEDTGGSDANNNELLLQLEIQF